MYKVKRPNVRSFFGRYHDFTIFTSDKKYNEKSRVESVPSKQRLPVDQYCGRDFAIDSHGWPMSDLALLAKAQTQQELDLAMSRIKELQISGVDNSGKSLAQVMNDIVPRWCQTPAELQRYAKYYQSLSLDQAPEETEEESKEDDSSKKSSDNA